MARLKRCSKLIQYAIPWNVLFLTWAVFLPGSEGMSALWNLFTPASSHIISAFSRTTSNSVPTCYPKAWYFYSLFWDIDIFLNNPSEHIKAFSGFIFTPLSFHGRETQFTDERWVGRWWYHFSQVKNKPRSLISVDLVYSLIILTEFLNSYFYAFLWERSIAGSMGQFQLFSSSLQINPAIIPLERNC